MDLIPKNIKAGNKYHQSLIKKKGNPKYKTDYHGWKLNKACNFILTHTMIIENHADGTQKR